MLQTTCEPLQPPIAGHRLAEVPARVMRSVAPRFPTPLDVARRRGALLLHFSPSWTGLSAYSTKRVFHHGICKEADPTVVGLGEFVRHPVRLELCRSLGKPTRLHDPVKRLRRLKVIQELSEDRTASTF
jgi:hypothetical protein